MKIVIEIPEDVKKAFDNATKDDLYGCYYDANSVIGNAIKNGTPLPKGHGRLIDADSMKTMKNIQSANFNAVELIRFWIDSQPTIIEADNGYDVKAITRGNCMACGKELTEGVFFCKECEEKGRKEGEER